MDDLTARLADLFRRYMVEFRRMALLSEAEMEQVTEPFRREVDAMIAEHGREAVGSGCAPTAGRPVDHSLTRCSSSFAARSPYTLAPVQELAQDQGPGRARCDAV
jgi:hypothetical protein